MKLKISTIAALIGLMLFASACAGIGGGDGMPVELPGIESGLTEAGNPTEEETEIKGVYINREFLVRIDYPVTWSVEERGSEEAQFSSSKSEAVTAQFVWLEEGENFHDFIVETRGTLDGTKTYIDTAFDITVCAVDDLAHFVSGMIIVECYHYNKTSTGDSVIVVSGFVRPDTGSAAIIASPVDADSGKSQSAEESDELIAEFTSQDGDSGERQHRPKQRSNEPIKAKLISGWSRTRGVTDRGD